MRAAAELASRNFEVRCAARDWARAGEIDDAARAAIETAYSDDRVRLGPVFRFLFFVFSLVAVFAAFGLFFVAGVDDVGVLALVFGVGLAAATEIQIGAFRRAQGGTEDATSLLACVFLIAGTGWIFWELWKFRDDFLSAALYAFAAFLFAAAASRWGFALYAALSAICFFALLGYAPAGRMFWIIAALVLAPILVAAGDAPRLAPAHRRGCQFAAAVCFAALYLAAQIYSLDHGLIEVITEFDFSDLSPSRLERLSSIVATAAIPAAFILLGIAQRRRLLLDVGLLAALVSLVTLRQYVHLAPLWLLLTLGGAAAIAGALILRRYLDAGAGKRRGGFTAEPLFEKSERVNGLEIAAAVAAFSPEGRKLPASDDDGFIGGGGGYGGGGASGSY